MAYFWSSSCQFSNPQWLACSQDINYYVISVSMFVLGLLELGFTHMSMFSADGVMTQSDLANLGMYYIKTKYYKLDGEAQIVWTFIHMVFYNPVIISVAIMMIVYNSQDWYFVSISALQLVAIVVDYYAQARKFGTSFVNAYFLWTQIPDDNIQKIQFLTLQWIFQDA